MEPEKQDLIKGKKVGEYESGTPPVICCVACYNDVGVKKEDHCCKTFDCGLFFGCCGCFSTKKPGKPYVAPKEKETTKTSTHLIKLKL
jgi:hypothetical protein